MASSCRDSRARAATPFALGLPSALWRCARVSVSLRDSRDACVGIAGDACEVRRQGRPLVGPPIRRCSKFSPWWRRAARQVSAPHRCSRVGHWSRPTAGLARSFFLPGRGARPAALSLVYARGAAPRLPRGSRRPSAASSRHDFHPPRLHPIRLAAGPCCSRWADAPATG